MTKRIGSIVLICVFMLTILLVPVSASTYKSVGKTATTLGHTFSRKWKDYGTYKVSGVYYDFTYGFDTYLIDEDYIEDVCAQTSGTEYYGKVKGTDTATDVTSVVSNKAKTGTASVTHSGNTVTYYVYARSAD